MFKDLARSLRDARDLAPRGQVVVRIHLFGIAYARQLEGIDLAALAREAGVPETFATEIHKGMRLAEFVTLKRPVEFCGGTALLPEAGAAHLRCIIRGHAKPIDNPMASVPTGEGTAGPAL